MSKRGHCSRCSECSCRLPAAVPPPLVVRVLDGHQPDVAPICRADAKDLRSSSKLKLGQVGLGWPASMAIVGCAAAGFQLRPC